MKDVKLIIPTLVLQAEDKRYRAQINVDISELTTMFHDQLVYRHSNGQIDDRDTLLHLIRSRTVKYNRMKRLNETVRIFGNVGVITGEADFNVTVRGEDVDFALYFHSMWVQDDISLKFVSWQATLIP